MNINNFDYKLPNNLIAQSPIDNRDESKLLIYNKKNNTFLHKKFSDIVDYLSPNDVLVLNDTKVIPARLKGIKKETNANIEILLLKEVGFNTWEIMCKPAKRVKIDTEIVFGDGILKCKCLEVKEEGLRIVEFIYKGIFLEILNKVGQMPIPPYIKKDNFDQDRYQTVYANHSGSAAAPTAGLHFTKHLLKKIEKKGIDIIYVTLHVGLGTFKPITVDNINDHKMHSETYHISDSSADKLNNALKYNKNIISVGTTSTRVLESAIKKNNFIGSNGETNIYIYPGYKFKVVDKLITNFHLPKSSLLLLMSALIGKEKLFQLYEEAIKKEYMFFSYGDAMFVI